MNPRTLLKIFQKKPRKNSSPAGHRIIPILKLSLQIASVFLILVILVSFPRCDDIDATGQKIIEAEKMRSYYLAKEESRKEQVEELKQDLKSEKQKSFWLTVLIGGVAIAAVK